MPVHDHHLANVSMFYVEFLIKLGLETQPFGILGARQIANHVLAVLDVTSALQSRRTFVFYTIHTHSHAGMLLSSTAL